MGSFRSSSRRRKLRGLRHLRDPLPDGAVYLGNGAATLDLDRCIGCGLCVTTCPSEALSLVRKLEAKQPYVPEDIVESRIRMGQARGRTGGS